MGLHYDAGQGTIRTALRCAGTVVPNVLRRTAFWLFLAIHLAVVVLYRLDIIPRTTAVPYTKVDWKEVEVITGITTFFQVFYISQCFTRYTQHYQHTRSLITQLTVVMFDVRLRVRSASAGHARMACRYLLAAAMLFFRQANPNVKVAGGDSGSVSVEADGPDCCLLSCRDSECEKPLNEDNIHSEAISTGLNRLLTEAELTALQNTVKRHRPLILLEWTIELIILSYKKVKTPANAQQAIMTKIFECSHLMRHLIDLLSLPVPFQYFHLLNMMVCINVLVWAYAMGASDAGGGTAIFIAAELIFMGMMELASALADPFGDDEVDFPLNEWFAELCQRADTLLEYRYDGDKADNWEPLLAAESRLNLHLIQARNGKQSA